MSPEKTPFFTFSIASVITSLLLTDFAISKLSRRLTPAALKFPNINDILANIDFKIISPNIGNFKTCLCHFILKAAFFFTVYLNPKMKIIPPNKIVFPPAPLKKSLIAIIVAVAAGSSNPIPSYILANTGTTFTNMKALTVIATVNIIIGYISADLIFFLIFSFFSSESTILSKNTSNLPLASPALIKLMYTLSKCCGYFSKHLDKFKPPSRLFRMSSIISLIPSFSI